MPAGAELAGATYQPPFSLVDIPAAHRVVTGTFVTTDDGTGLAPDEISDPRSSLRMLGAWLSERNGDIRHSAKPGGGTTAVAYWRADPGHRHGPAELELMSQD